MFETAIDHKSKAWLLECREKGLSQRDMAKLAGISAHSIRLWLKKHDIAWRTISESLLQQSNKVSARSKKVWSDPAKRTAHSKKMQDVQAKRKSQLSVSAKKNWAENRATIVKGIRKAAIGEERKRKCSAAAKLAWQDDNYRQLICSMIRTLWEDPSYRALVSQRNRETVNIEAIKKRWTDPQYRSKMITMLKQKARDNKKNCKIYNGEFVTECIDRYGDLFNYTNTRPTNWQTRMEVVCKRCGNKLLKFPLSHVLYGYCNYCGLSSEERELCSLLDSLDQDYTVGDRIQISPLELDIYLPSKRLAIEHHGIYWHSYKQPETTNQKLRHQTKAIACHKAEIKLLQFFDFELQTKSSIITSMITNALGLSTPLSARKLSIKEINNKEANKFFSTNHLAGYRPAKTTMALTNDEIIVMAASFSKHKDGYEIIRLATKTGLSVRGGASKILAHFLKKQKGNIYTYADMRYSTGAVYLSLGFSKTHITKPGYFYYKGNRLLSRQRCQKHKLSKLLEHYDPALSESLNMFYNGYRRVWDAGHTHFALVTTKSAWD